MDSYNIIETSSGEDVVELWVPVETEDSGLSRLNWSLDLHRLNVKYNDLTIE